MSLFGVSSLLCFFRPWDPKFVIVAAFDLRPCISGISHCFKLFGSDNLCQPPFSGDALGQVSCGLSLWGSTGKLCNAQLQRHEGNHVDEGDLELDNGPSTCDTCLFVIMSHRHNHGARSGCKAWLKKLKVPKRSICVVYGYKLHEDHHRRRPLKSNEIRHYGVHHRWFPKVK